MVGLVRFMSCSSASTVGEALTQMGGRGAAFAEARAVEGRGMLRLLSGAVPGFWAQQLGLRSSRA